MNLVFNYLEGSNEGIVGREKEMRGSMVKCRERPLWCYGNWNTCG